jgi:hypothetical protein
VGRADEGTLVASRALIQVCLELFLGDQALSLGLGALGLDSNGGLDTYFAGLGWIEDSYTRGPEVDQVVHYGINGIVGPVRQAHHDLIGGGDNGDLALLGIV